MKEKLKTSLLVILTSVLSLTFASCSSDGKESNQNIVENTESYVSSDTAELTTDSSVTTENIDTESLEPYDFWKTDEYRAKLTYDMDKFEPYEADIKSTYENKNEMERVVLRCRKCGEFCNENMKYLQIISSEIHTDEEIEKLNGDAQILSDMWKFSSYCGTYDTPVPPALNRDFHFPDECRARFNLDLWYMRGDGGAFGFADQDTLEELSIQDILGEQWSDYVYSVYRQRDGKFDIRQADNKIIQDIMYFPDENVLSATAEFTKITDENYISAWALMIVPGDKAVQKYLVKSE